MQRPTVVPYIGTWIETSMRNVPFVTCPVVPYIGTWIETGIGAKKRQEAAVVPYIGTWIETETWSRAANLDASYLI